MMKPDPVEECKTHTMTVYQPESEEYKKWDSQRAAQATGFELAVEDLNFFKTLACELGAPIREGLSLPKVPGKMTNF